MRKLLQKFWNYLKNFENFRFGGKGGPRQKIDFFGKKFFVPKLLLLCSA
jgi:hypothetical protein